MSHSFSGETRAEELRLGALEALEAQREREARKIFSAFRLWEHGKDRCIETESPVEALDAAQLLREHLRENAGGADDFARKI